MVGLLGGTLPRAVLAAVAGGVLGTAGGLATAGQLTPAAAAALLLGALAGLGAAALAGRAGRRGGDDQAAALEALHARVRLGDRLGEGRRVQAQTAGAAVHELLTGLVTAEEDARSQLAAELHDTVAQSLMLARGLLSDGTPAPSDFLQVRMLVEDAEEQVRALLARTRPPALRDGDLADAVGALGLDLHARYGLRVQLRWPPLAYALPLATAVTLYRFFQEALLNVVKHADVDDALIELEVTTDAVRATVTDRGPGFVDEGSPGTAGRRVGLGLLCERARLAGGSLQVLSALGTGTTLVLELPRTPEPAARSLTAPAR